MLFRHQALHLLQLVLPDVEVFSHCLDVVQCLVDVSMNTCKLSRNGLVFLVNYFLALLASQIVLMVWLDRVSSLHYGASVVVSRYGTLS